MERALALRFLMTMLLGALLLAAPARAEWLLGETEHFRLYSDLPEAELRGYASDLEEYHTLLLQLTGTKEVEKPRKLDIYVIKSAPAFRTLMPVPFVIGFYASTARATAAFSLVDKESASTSRNTLFHEYAHHFMLHHHPGAYPPWYVEGFAEYVAAARFEDTTIEYGGWEKDRAAWASYMTGWRPWDEIIFGHARGGMFYPQSWLLVHYLYRTPGRLEQLRAYLSSRGRGGKADRIAFKEAFGTDARKMGREIAGYVRGKIGYSRITRTGPRPIAPITISRLPREADKILLPAIGIRLEVGKTESSRLLSRLRNGAEDSADLWAQRALAEGEIRFGDRAAGVEIVDRLLAADTNSVELLYLRGLADLLSAREGGVTRDKLLSSARARFTSAFKRDPENVPVLIGYVEAAGSAVPMRKDVLDVLLTAQAIAPEVAAIRYNAALALAQSGDFDWAKRMITPLATQAHKTDQSTAAEALLVKVEAGERPTEAISWK